MTRDATNGLQSDPMPKKTILDEVFEKAGGQAALAAKLTAATGESITRQAVNKWKRVPQQHVRTIAALTGIGLKRLRPDLFDVDMPALRRQIAARVTA